jgi:hypothetical protein
MSRLLVSPFRASAHSLSALLAQAAPGSTAADPLAQLRDITAPAAPPFWPPAPGWWVLMALALVVVWLLYRWAQPKFAKRRRVQAWQRLLAQLEQKTSEQYVMGASELARRIALRHDAHAAKLSGQAWLEHLDGLAKSPVFSQGGGRALHSLPYQKSASSADRELLKRALLRLIDQAA